MEKSHHNIPLVTDQFEKGNQSSDHIAEAVGHHWRVYHIIIKSLLLSIATNAPACFVYDRLVRWALFHVNPSSRKNMGIWWGFLEFPGLVFSMRDHLTIHCLTILRGFRASKCFTVIPWDPIGVF